MTKFNEDINCHTCKYGYFEDISEDGQHNLCGKRNCSFFKAHIST